MAEPVLCGCERGEYYDPDKYRTCYLCFRDRAEHYRECIFCGRWHAYQYDTCFKCRTIPRRDEAGRHLRMDIMIRDDATCQECGLRDTFMQVDHIKPCKRGGRADPWNLQILCIKCNQEKGGQWKLISHYGEARIELMHIYFTTMWSYLTDEQKNQLKDDARAEYPTRVFEHHARLNPPQHNLCPDCDRDAPPLATYLRCFACGQAGAT